MVLAKFVCGACSSELSQSDKFCPQCGSAIEGPGVSHAHNPSHAANVRCKACGNVVNGSANFCESCGVALRPTDPTREEQRPKHQDHQGKTPTTQGAVKSKGKKKFSFEPWQIGTGVVIVGLIVYFTYLEINRDQPVERSVPLVQEKLPAQSAAMMKEIDELQQTVDGNPKDDASAIRLANMLHDAAMSNPDLLRRAIDAYGKYLKLKPNDPNARVDLGICYFEMARADTINGASLFKTAIREMEIAIKANPNHQPAAFNLGVVNLNAGNFEKSTEWFGRAVKINPTSDLGKKAQQLLDQHSFQSPPN